MKAPGITKAQTLGIPILLQKAPKSISGISCYVGEGSLSKASGSCSGYQSSLRRRQHRIKPQPGAKFPSLRLQVHKVRLEGLEF